MEGIDVEFTDVSLTVNVWDPLATKTLRPGKINSIYRVSLNTINYRDFKRKFAFTVAVAKLFFNKDPYKYLI